MNGINWEEEKRSREEHSDFDEEYSETHHRTERINDVPPDGHIYPESGQKASILSDGENGRLETISHKELIRCNCGCVVDSVMKTRKDAGGRIVCEKHAVFCRLCSNLILPNEMAKVNESYYHRQTCALKVINRILEEYEYKPEGFSPIAVGELRAIKEEIVREKYRACLDTVKSKVMDLISGKGSYGIKKR